MSTNHEKLEAIKARFPKNRQHDIDKAFELGKNSLEETLASKPRPAGTSPAAMPPLQQSLLYHALLLKVQAMQIPCHKFDLKREEKMRMGTIQTQTDANLTYLLKLLPTYLKIGYQPDAAMEHLVSQMSPKDADEYRTAQANKAVQEYFDNFSTILWEGMDALLSCEDAVYAVSILRLLQEEGKAAVQLVPDSEVSQLQVA